MYHKRRYKVVDGRLQKRWDATDDNGWHKTKAEALEAAKVVSTGVYAVPPEVPKKRGRPRKDG